VLLVGISVAVSIPVAWYYMSRWLVRFEYRTTISWWIFALAALVALIITLATVSYQSIKAAIGNPLQSLRSE
jgi:putative ABC transport system permease protein